MATSVTTVIVTYNRKDLLERCIRAVLKQTYSPARVIVIDNASTDGTESHLEQAGILDVMTVQYVRLTDNTGGAGGFFEGVKRAYEDGAALLWLMDDDGVPDEDCLEKLVRISELEPIHYAAPNLIADNGESHFVNILSAAKTNVISFRGGPFNGILISRALVRAVGYPMKNYFIWGDEYEYTNRIQDAGFPMVMVTEAVHRHRSTKYSLSRCPRPYHLVRNRIYTIRLSKGLYLSRKVQSIQLAQLAARLLIGGFVVFNFIQIGQVILGVIHGLRDPLESFQQECRWGGIPDQP
jgi:rhamnopyranosyl-N-acetylglucosaminyl-diphospho-decaprenol beta-1,3/1,4-galactofuranosyltransferase